METPRNINYDRLKQAITKEDVVPKKGTGLGVVRASDLIKVGGLYRIRDNYEAVWRMEAEEDGKRYIVRADIDEANAGTPERLRVESDANPADHAKAAAAVAPEVEPIAYKVVHAGAVYVAWECEACATPNLTKFGNTYECDECHKRYADVLKTEQPRKAVLTRDEVAAEFGGEFVQRMAKLGIRLAHRSLLDVWTREAEVADPPDEPGRRMQQSGKKKCKSCGAKMSGSSVLSECPSCIDKKGAKAVNPWAVCHKSVGPEKSEKFERCVKDVKKKSPVKKD